MNVITCEIPGLVVVEPKVFGDARGFFMETWNRQSCREAGLDWNFVQDNVSLSRRFLELPRGRRTLHQHRQVCQRHGATLWQAGKPGRLPSQVSSHELRGPERHVRGSTSQR